MLHGAGVFTNIYPNKITQFCRFWYTSTMVRIWGAEYPKYNNHRYFFRGTTNHFSPSAERRWRSTDQGPNRMDSWSNSSTASTSSLDEGHGWRIARSKMRDVAGWRFFWFWTGDIKRDRNRDENGISWDFMGFHGISWDFMGSIGKL